MNVLPSLTARVRRPLAAALLFNAATLCAVPPTIDRQPLARTVAPGAAVTFAVGVSGTAPFTYQWKKNATDITGATNAVLALTNVQSGDAASYAVRVTNADGEVTSTSAALTVVPPLVTLMLKNDPVLKAPLYVVADGLYLYITGTTSADTQAVFRKYIFGSTANKLYSAYNPMSIAVVGGTLFWIDPNSGPATDTQLLRASADGMGTVTSIYTGSASGQPIVDGSGLTSDGVTLYAADEVNGSVWRLNPDGSGLTQIGPNRYGGGFSTEHLNTVAISKGVLFIADSGRAGATTPQVVSIATDGSSFTTLHAGAPLVQPTGIAVGEDTVYVADVGANTIWQLPRWGGATPTPLVTSGSPVTFGSLYGVACLGSDVVVADNAGGALYRISSTSTAAPPHFLNTPMGKTALVGGTVKFVMAVSGTEPITYQWKKNGTDVSGATTAALTLSSLQLTDAGNYTLLATNSAGSMLTVDMPLTVAASAPANDNFAAAATLTGETAQATGTNIGATLESGEPDHSGSEGYSAGLGGASVWWQWTAPANGAVRVDTNGTAIPPILAVYTGNAVNSLTPIGTAMSGVATSAATVDFFVNAGTVYRFAFDGFYGATGAVVLNLAPTTGVAPSIQSQPYSTSVSVGGSAYFSAWATGTNPLTYQWKKGGVDIPGATLHHLSLREIQLSDAGSYSVVITNALGSATSNAATLTVGAPVITTHPTAQTVAVGGTATFSVAATGLGTLTYQWSKAGTALTDGGNVSGATTATLTLTNVQSTDAGSYTVTVGNSYGSVTSASATLNVPGGAGPANDNFANRIALSGASVTTTVNSVGATKETGEPNHAGSSGGASVWWTWTAPGSGEVTIDTDLSLFDTVLGVYTGTAVNALTLVAADDDSGPGTTSLVTFTAVAGTVYQIAVDGFSGASGAVTLHVAMGGSPVPVINSAPTATATTGVAFSYTTTATNSPTSYAASGLPTGLVIDASTGVISGTTTATGSYTVTLTATNAAGTSAGFTLTLTVQNATTAPANDNFASAQLITGSTGSAAGTTVNATGETNEPTHVVAAGTASSVWYQWSPPSSGIYEIATDGFTSTGSDFDTVLAVYSGTALGNLIKLAQDDDNGTAYHASQVRVTLVGGTAYYIAVGSYTGVRGSFTLGWRGPIQPPNDNFASAQALSGPSGSVGGTNVNATGETGEPAHVTAESAGNSVWYSWTPSQSGRYAFNTDGADFDTVMAVYTGSALASLTKITQDDDGGSTYHASRVAFDAVAGTTYFIAVAGYYNGARGVFTLTWGPEGGTAPTITTQPVAQYVVEGTTATFTVTATGTAPLTYQWKKGTGTLVDGGNIAGATTATLTISPVQFSNAGSYSCVVSNAAGNTPSDAVMLTVLAPNNLLGLWGADGNVVDASGRNAAGTLQGGATFGAGVVGQAFVFDGVDDWIDLGAQTGDFGTADFTIAFWARFNDISREQTVIEDYVETESASRAGWGINFKDGGVFFGYNGGRQLTSPALAASTWYHIAVTRYAGTFTLYVDGVARGAVTEAVTLSSTASLKLGHRGAPADTPGSVDTRGFYLNGALDDVRIYGRALAASEVQAFLGGTPTSTFAVDAEGWGVVSFTNLVTNDYSILGTYPPSFAVTGGNPGGYIWITDPDGGDFTFSASAAFLGNRASSVGATLSYDLIHPVGTVNLQAADVILTGNGTRLVWQSSPLLVPSTSAWTRVTVPLSPSAQWHVGTLAGAAATTADFQNVLGNLSGLYIRGEYTDGADTTGLDNVVLGVAGPITGAPVIATQPNPLTVAIGGTAIFAVTATGNAPLSYQWKCGPVNVVDGTNVSGATTATLTLTNVQPANAGVYTCVVSNTAGTAVSNGAQLTVSGSAVGLPMVMGQPRSQTAVAGAPVTLRVQVAGTGPISYQWRKAGTDISGATNPALGFSSVALGDAGSYTVQLTNAAGSVVSPPIALTVASTAPANDLFANAVALTGTTVSTTGSNIGATFQSGEPDHVGHGGEASHGGNSVWWQWTAPANGVFAVDTIGSNFDTLLAVYTGGAVNALTLVGANDQGGGNNTSALSFVATSGTTYRIAVDGYGGATGAITLHLAATTASLPSFASQAGDRTVPQGSFVALGAAVSGTAPFTYQWRKDGTPVTGATMNPLMIASVQPSQAGTYTLVVTNGQGSATSQPIVLTVTTTPYVEGYGVAKFQRMVQDSTSAPVAASSTPFSFEALAYGTNLAGMTPPAFSSPATSTVTGGTMAYDANRGRWAFVSSSYATLAGLSPDFKDGTYSVAVNGATVNLALVAGTPLPVAPQITGATWTAGSLQVNATSDYVLSFTPFTNALGSCLIDLRINLGAGGGGFQRVSFDPAVTSFVIPAGTLTAGATYQAHLEFFNFSTLDLAALPNSYGGAGVATRLTFTIAAAAGNVAPTISLQPQSQVAAVGGTATFAVTASGTPSPTYQWRKNGLNITGATAATLTLNGVQTGDAGNYTVVVTNSAGSVTSAPATLTVNEPAVAPAITTQPVSQTVNAGTNVSFTVVATGTPPLTYQWTKNGSTLAGATTATLALSNVQSGDAANYAVVVGNAAGTVTSAPALLTVNTVNNGVSATLAVAGAPVYVPAGGNITLSGTITYTGLTASALGFTINVPTGWAYVGLGSGGNVPPVVPAAGTTGALEFAYTAPPTNSATFNAVVSYPAGLTGSQTISASAIFRTSGADPQTVPVPNVVLTRIEPPVITAHPSGRVTRVSGSVTFTVNASSSASVTYQWQKDGTAVAGATTSSLTLNNVQPTDAGSYTVVVTNAAGSVTSNSAALVVINVTATHAVSGGGYNAGGTVTITNTLTYSGTAAGLGWQTLLPTGWSYASGGGSEGDVKPTANTTDLLEWAWTSIGASPLTFTYTLNVPVGTTGEKTLAALVLFRQGGNLVQFMATPDPLTLVEAPPYHSGDSDRNSRISLLELTRVIELYNTRFNTTRTGAYKVQDGTEDGFAPEPTRSGSTTVTLTKYHSGDSSRDGKLSLLELTRVIELYNYRSGTTRTGQYHVQAGTEDGFAPGP